MASGSIGDWIVESDSGPSIEIDQILGRFNPVPSFEAKELAHDYSSANVDVGNHTLQRNIMAEEPLFILDPPDQDPPVIAKFDIEQEFEGSVIAIDPDGEIFTARLVDVSGDGPDEEAEFSLREITDDRHLVVPGAIFSWIIGLQWRRRQSVRVSEIRFRRLPPFSEETIARAEARAHELAKLLAKQDAAPKLPSAR